MADASRRAHDQLTLTILALGGAAFALLQSVVTPVLSSIQDALQTTQSNATWILTVYLLSASIFTPIMGRLGDMYGKKRFLLVALLGLAVGSLIAALASSLTVMLVGRVIQGIGGGLLPLAFGIIRDEFPAEKVAGAIGFLAAIVAVGVGIGIALAGPIIEILDYHWLFWIPLILVSLVVIAAYLVIPESRVRTAGRVNWLNAALFASWLIALLLAVSQGPVWGWSSSQILGLAMTALVVLLVWIWAEARSANPLIDMRMMRIRAVWSANLAALLMGIGLYASLAFLPQLLQTPPSAGFGFGVTVVQSGLILLPQTVGMFVMGLAAGRLTRRFGSKSLLLFALTVSMIGYLMLAFLHTSLAPIFLAMSILGVGVGLAFSAMANVVVGAVPQEQTGVASGMNLNIRTVGGALGAALMSSVVAAGGFGSGSNAGVGYTHGFALLGVAVAFAAIAAVFIPGARGGMRNVRDDAAVAQALPNLAAAAAGRPTDAEPTRDRP